MNRPRAFIGPEGETDGYGNGLCHLHGYLATIDENGNLWCPYCGWVGRVDVRWDSKRHEEYDPWDDDD